MTTKKKTSFGLEESGLCCLVLVVLDSYVGMESKHAFKYWYQELLLNVNLNFY